MSGVVCIGHTVRFQEVCLEYKEFTTAGMLRERCRGKANSQLSDLLPNDTIDSIRSRAIGLRIQGCIQELPGWTYVSFYPCLTYGLTIRLKWFMGAVSDEVSERSLEFIYRCQDFSDSFLSSFRKNSIVSMVYTSWCKRRHDDLEEYSLIHIYIYIYVVHTYIYIYQWTYYIK